jgi:hypothetical protein
MKRAMRSEPPKNPRNMNTDLFAQRIRAALPNDASVSRFQEKEKRGEMITINDNIK